VGAGGSLQTGRGRFPSIGAMVQISQSCGAARTPLAKLLACGVAGVLACTAAVDAAASETPDAPASRGDRLAAKPQPDLSGRERTGIASFYAARFAGRKMADGSRMDPNSNNAASRTLPLGTIAAVTDLTTQKSALVTIQDRGPYVKGRIVDLSPSTARKIGITPRMGIARVRVTPLVVPLPDGRVRLASAGSAQPVR
jgi:rare lipoprotein A